MLNTATGNEQAFVIGDYADVKDKICQFIQELTLPCPHTVIKPVKVPLTMSG